MEAKASMRNLKLENWNHQAAVIGHQVTQTLEEKFSEHGTFATMAGCGSECTNAQQQQGQQDTPQKHAAQRLQSLLQWQDQQSPLKQQQQQEQQQEQNEEQFTALISQQDPPQSQPLP